DVLEYVHGLAQGEQRACRHLDAPSTRVALREVLRGRSQCGAGATNDSLAPFQQGRLSLPESVEGPPRIGDVCGRRGHYLGRKGERVLEPVAEVAADLERDGARCYCDPALVKHKTDLDDDLLASVAERLSVTAGVADVKDAFHRSRVPPFLRRYFRFPSVRSGAAGLAGQVVGGVVLTGNEQVWPCPVAFPMGFSWGLFFCRVSGEELACVAPPLSPDSLLRDRGRPLVLGCERGVALRHYIYVGNMGIVGAESERVKSTLDGVAEVFMQEGLLVHEQARRGRPLQDCCSAATVRGTLWRSCWAT
ncbi:unnamed protein product, partial [Prorocentrum cordatum]